jgi:rubrerythrin
MVNLESAAEGEKEEWSSIYPSMAKVADEEGFPAAASTFRKVAGVEIHHEIRYDTLLQRLRNGTYFKRESKVRWKCLKCGHIHEAEEAPKACPVCTHPQGWFTPAEANW